MTIDDLLRSLRILKKTLSEDDPESFQFKEARIKLDELKSLLEIKKTEKENTVLILKKRGRPRAIPEEKPD